MHHHENKRGSRVSPIDLDASPDSASNSPPSGEPNKLALAVAKGLIHRMRSPQNCEPDTAPPPVPLHALQKQPLPELSVVMPEKPSYRDALSPPARLRYSASHHNYSQMLREKRAEQAQKPVVTTNKLVSPTFGNSATSPTGDLLNELM